MRIYGKYLSFQTVIVLYLSVIVIVPWIIVALGTIRGADVKLLLSVDLLTSIILGVFGGWFLAKRIKLTLFGFEPGEMAMKWLERNAIMEAVHEGIIAVNRDFQIVVVNQAAMQMLKKAGIYDEPVGENVNDFFPVSRMRSVMQTGLPEYDQEIDLNGNWFYVNHFPVVLNGQVVGAIATFRDKTELKQLLEQLTGIKIYTDALRLQTHEFMNKLHVILGMIYIGDKEKLIDYIHQTTNQYQMEVGVVSRLVKDPVLAGFFLSKLSFAHERDIKLGIDALGNEPIPVSPNPEIVDDIITVIGNLIDNAFDAVRNNKMKLVEVSLQYSTGQLTVSVKDNGDGISYRIQGMIFEKSFSTKGKNRGYGLYLTKQRLERMGGSLTFRTTEEGTIFIATFPYASGGEIHDHRADY